MIPEIDPMKSFMAKPTQPMIMIHEILHLADREVGGEDLLQPAPSEFTREEVEVRNY